MKNINITVFLFLLLVFILGVFLYSERCKTKLTEWTAIGDTNSTTFMREDKGHIWYAQYNPDKDEWTLKDPPLESRDPLCYPGSPYLPYPECLYYPYPYTYPYPYPYVISPSITIENGEDRFPRRPFQPHPHPHTHPFMPPIPPMSPTSFPSGVGLT